MSREHAPGPWKALVARCTPAAPTPEDAAIGEVYALMLAGGAPLLLVFTLADLLKGRRDRSYWREIPVNLGAFGALAAMAMARDLPRAARGLGLALPLTAVAISDQAAAGAGGLAPALLTANSAVLASWHPRGDGIAAALTTLAMLGPAWLARPSPGRARAGRKGGVSLQRWGVTLLSGLVAGRAARALRERQPG